MDNSSDLRRGAIIDIFFFSPVAIVVGKDFI